MLVFDKLFADVPVGRTVSKYWRAQDLDALERAAAIIIANGAHPWPFAGNEQHFNQFAGPEERRALEEMSADESAAVLYWIEKTWEAPDDVYEDWDNDDDNGDDNGDDE